MSIGSHHSAAAMKDEWLTPPEIIAALGEFDLDPCAPIQRPWPTAKKHFTFEDDGLSKEWDGRVWCNPPYGRKTRDWLRKCSQHKNATVLIFARTETDDWRDFVWTQAHAILFIYGRLYFHHVSGLKAKGNSGGPSAIISYNAINTLAIERSRIAGKLIIL